MKSVISSEGYLSRTLKTPLSVAQDKENNLPPLLDDITSVSDATSIDTLTTPPSTAKDNRKRRIEIISDKRFGQHSKKNNGITMSRLGLSDDNCVIKSRTTRTLQAQNNIRRTNTIVVNSHKVYREIGLPTYECELCGALMYTILSDCHYDATLIMQITQMLDGCNPLVMQYRRIKEHVKSRNVNNLRMKLVRKRTSDARTYNLPTASEVAALIVGDFDIEKGKRDMIVEHKSGQLSAGSICMVPSKKLRLENYETLTSALFNGQVSSASIGKRIILPSLFTGSQRYSRENFQDAMTICTATGFPDLFITFTCNPRWPELDKLFNGLKDKLTTASQIDSIIFAEISNANAHPELHEAVKSFMLHGPSGASRTSSPCMQNGKYSKHSPKKFSERTLFDDDGYAKYRRRYTGIRVMKNGVEFDNMFVVPYNPTLLLRYWAHINIKFCNQSRSIKYLFKYVSKGYDGVTTSLSSNNQDSEGNDFADEIKKYYDCHYISLCEAAWRIFGFDINFRESSIEQLPFHLSNEQSPTSFEDIRTINGVLHPTYKDAFYALGLLDDDKEYIDGITEANRWSSGVYLRKLFSTLLIHNTIARPVYVWDKTWMHLSDDILIKERHRLLFGKLPENLFSARMRYSKLLKLDKFSENSPKNRKTDTIIDGGSSPDNLLLPKSRSLMRDKQKSLAGVVPTMKSLMRDKQKSWLYRGKGGDLMGATVSNSLNVSSYLSILRKVKKKLA
ncbi:ATP-dependent DNA helicase PIF1 [Senna tora]|uniref:ATP-dependent DNA helicase PIF1 n=1 Tax=Senna tora TaxID=362788 RepID=A0A835C9M3_9FABA|nr:ATP-dependent DNA helicase PIF1 [Senna tora]